MKRPSYDPLMKRMLENGKLIEMIEGWTAEKVEQGQKKVRIRAFHKTADWIAWMELKDAEQDRALIHVELQLKNDPEMLQRMLVYGTGIRAEYGVYPHQYVVYRERNSLPFAFEEGSARLDCKVIYISDIDAEWFLSEDQPEIFIFAIWAKTEQPAALIRRILSKLQSCGLSQEKLKNFTIDLQTLALKTNYLDEITKQIKSMPFYVEIEKHPVFNEGFLKGKAETIAQAARLMLETGTMSLNQIAQIFQMTDDELLKLINTPSSSSKKDSKNRPS